MTVSRSIYVAADGIISFFYDWVIFYCIYVHFHTSFCVWECIICIMNSPCIHGFLRYTLSIYDCYSKLVHSMISDVNFLLSVILTRLLTYCLLIIYLFNIKIFVGTQVVQKLSTLQHKLTGDQKETLWLYSFSHIEMCIECPPVHFTCWNNMS